MQPGPAIGYYSEVTQPNNKIIYNIEQIFILLENLSGLVYFILSIYIISLPVIFLLILNVLRIIQRRQYLRKRIYTGVQNLNRSTERATMIEVVTQTKGEDTKLVLPTKLLST